MTGTTGQVALSPDKERQILNGAAEVFAQDGYEGASMSRIALAANVSKGTLYNYFTSKAHLFSAHVATMCAEHLAIVFNDLTPEQEIRHTLQMIGTRMLAMFCAEEGLAIFRVIISEAPKFPELAQAFFMAGPAVVIARTAQFLRAASEAGHLKIDDPEFAAGQFCALIQTDILLKRRLELIPAIGEQDIARVVTAGVDMFLRYYATLDKPLLR